MQKKIKKQQPSWRTADWVGVTLFSYRIRFTRLFSWKRRSGGALVKRITYHLREIWYALRHFREVNPILLANPCDCPWRQHLCSRLHAKTRQSVPLPRKPAVKCGVTHSGSICQFVFVCAFHGLLFLTTDNRLQTTDLSVVFFVSGLLSSRLNADLQCNEYITRESGQFHTWSSQTSH